MASITSLTLEAADPARATAFYQSAFDLDGQVTLRGTDMPATGFRGFTVSLVVSQPADVESLFGTALKAGATEIKPVKRALWGCGGVVKAPDGTIWKVASSKKKDSGPVSRRFDDIVLLLGADDVAASKRFYVERGLKVSRGFGSRYVEFESPTGAPKLALYGRRAIAKDAGEPGEVSWAQGLEIGGDAGAFTDPDGFAWVDGVGS